MSETCFSLSRAFFGMKSFCPDQFFGGGINLSVSLSTSFLNFCRTWVPRLTELLFFPSGIQGDAGSINICIG